MSNEQRARDRGEEVPLRGGSGFRGGSKCDCQNTDGLHTTKDENTRGFTPPSSLFDFLCSAETKAITVRGHPARKVPITATPTYLSEYGTIHCPCGNSRRSLAAGKAKCGCVLRPLPYRRGNVGLKLGRFRGIYGKPRPAAPIQPLVERK